VTEVTRPFQVLEVKPLKKFETPAGELMSCSVIQTYNIPEPPDETSIDVVSNVGSGTAGVPIAVIWLTEKGPTPVEYDRSPVALLAAAIAGGVEVVEKPTDIGSAVALDVQPSMPANSAAAIIRILLTWFSYKFQKLSGISNWHAISKF
jgi:hypothetical protein